MTTVEDGEILEVDNDEVVDLCSDAEPRPSPASPSKLNPSHSRIRRNIAAFRANAYRGGDPFTYALNTQIDGDTTSASKPHLPPPSTHYDQSHNARNSLNESHSSSLPYLPNEEAYLRRSPYVADNPSTPVLQNGVREPSHAHLQSFLGRIPSRRERNASPLPSAALSGDSVWPYPAPPDSSGIHAEPHPAIQKRYDPERYSPEGDQSRFTHGPIYHAEPGPPPSVQYAMHQPSMIPADPSFRGLPFEMTQKQQLYSMNQMHDPPPSMYNHQTFSGIVRTEDGFFTRDDPNVTQPYRSKPEAANGLRVKREALLNQHKQLLLKRESLCQQDSYDRTYSFDAHHRAISDTAGAVAVNGLDESERRRTQAAPVNRSSPDEDAHRASPAESRECREKVTCANGVSENEDYDQGRSIPKGEHLQPAPPPLQDDASDGEISLPPFPSPVISLATAPDETPSPPSLKKKKPASIDSKKRLSELRMKALMSVKKRPTPQNSNSSIQPISPRCSPPLATTESVEALEELQSVRQMQEPYDNAKNNDVDVLDIHVQASSSSDEVIHRARIQADSVVQAVVGEVRKTMTRDQYTQWQEWPYQNRVVVDYSSDSSDSTDASDPEDDRPESNAAALKKGHRTSLYSREREIEAMKIRMVCLGKCPSMLMGGPKKLKSATGSTIKQIQKKTEGRTKHMNHPRTVTKVSTESTRLETVPNEEKCTTRDGQTVDLEDACSLEQACASGEMEPHPGTGQAKLTTGCANGVKPTAGSCRRPLSVSSAENPVSSEQIKNLELVSDDRPEKTKGQVLHDDKLSSNQTLPKEMNDKDSTAQVRTSRPPAAASGESPIAELKRRIAVIEKSRDLLKQQRHKKQRIAMDDETTGSCSAKSLPQQRPLHRNTNLVVDRQQILQVSKLEKSERRSAEVDSRERAQYERSSRYYGPKSSSSLQSLPVLKKGDVMNVDVDMPEVYCDGGGDSTARTAVQGTSKPVPQIPQDNAQRRYIDDLKLELEQKRKELMDERDHAEQLRTAEVAIAEAQAKLNFTRSRVADLHKELRKAGLEVLDAEKEYQRRVKAATQLRDADFVDLTESNPEQEYEGHLGYSLEDSGNGVGRVSNDLAIKEGGDIDKGQGEIVDYVLRPSPYSPSTGDYFTSCLRAFRAYLLRIPHHSKAKDRVSGSILSSTWDASLDPMKAICPQELRGQCSSKECDFQHLKVFKTPKDRALQVIEGIEGFFSTSDREKEAKAIINTRIAIHEGKDATAIISSLISTLCGSSKTVPYSCASE